MSQLSGQTGAGWTVEVLDDEPMRVADELRNRGSGIRALRIARSIDWDAACVLAALLAGACPGMVTLELEVDMRYGAERLTGMLETLIATSSSLRSLVLLVEPGAAPTRLISMALVSGIVALAVGSSQDVFDCEAQRIGELLRITSAWRVAHRSLILIRPMQSRCTPAGHVLKLEAWPKVVCRTAKMTALVHGMRLSVAPHGLAGGA